MPRCYACGGMVDEGGQHYAQGGEVDEEAEGELGQPMAEAEEFEAHEPPVSDQYEATQRMRDAALAEAYRGYTPPRETPPSAGRRETPQPMDDGAETKRKALGYSRGGGVFAGFKRRGG